MRFLIDSFPELERSCRVHSAPSRHEGTQAEGRSPEPLPLAKLQPAFLPPRAPGALLIHGNETKPEDGGTSAEHSVSSGWRLRQVLVCPLSAAVAEVAPRSFLLWRQEQTLFYPTFYFPKTCWWGNTFRSLPLSQVLLKVADDFRNYEGLVRRKAIQLHMPHSIQKSG